LRAPSRNARIGLVPFLLGTFVLAFPATVALAQSPYAAELLAFYPRYHENPARLDDIREGLEAALKTDPHVQDFLALAQLCFTWGDIRATSRAQKVAAYERGRQAARQAVRLSPQNAAAHFWYATNSARLGQTDWGIRSLFLLPTIREEIQTVLDLDPKFAPVYALAGDVFYEVPGFLGGDLDKAEEMFRKGLDLDPRFTEMRLGLGKTLIKRGRIAEGSRELQAVLDEKAPRYLADWTLKDSPEARKLLESIRSKP
jgi:tetratricopeptide (TPR) repeat protein